MTKIKTHKGLRKRLKAQTKTGLFIHRGSGTQHNLRHRQKDMKRAARHGKILNSVEYKRVSLYLPYGL